MGDSFVWVFLFYFFFKNIASRERGERERGWISFIFWKWPKWKEFYLIVFFFFFREKVVCICVSVFVVVVPKFKFRWSNFLWLDCDPGESVQSVLCFPFWRESRNWSVEYSPLYCKVFFFVFNIIFFFF